MTIAWDVYESPLGPLTIAAGPSGVTTLSFPGAARSEWDERDRDSAALVDAVAQLDAYFAGERRAFDLALDLRGTPLHRRARRARHAVPGARVGGAGPPALRRDRDVHPPRRCGRAARRGAGRRGRR